VRGRAGLEAVGVHRPLTGSGIRHDQGARARQMLVEGAWSARDDGVRVWRLAIESGDALGVRIHFTDFAVGVGRVWVYAGTDDARSESFSGKGPRDDGDFWSQTIFGSEALVEFEPGPASPLEEETPFQIKEIAHLWRTPDTLFPAPQVDASQARTIRSPREFLESLPAAGFETLPREPDPSRRAPR
jgi:hypothetical protein